MLFSDLPGDEGLPGRQRRLAMIAVMMTTAMSVFDGSMVNIALPQIAKAMQVPAAEIVWVSNGYLLAAAMTLAIFAALATRMGFRNLFATGQVIFTLASLGCALSSDPKTLIIMRILQGIGGAATLSIGPAILRSVFPNRLLGRILGMNALLVASSTAIAPMLGGSLLSAMSWQWLFAINLPPGIIAVMLTVRVLPGRVQKITERFDITGAVLSAIIPGALIMAADSFANTNGQGFTAHALLMAVGYAILALLAGTAFVWCERRASKPLLPLSIFASSRFSLAAMTSMASFVSQGITFIALPFLFQNVYGYSAFVSALLFTPWPVGIILAAPHSGRLSDRFPPAIISTVGLAIFVVGLVLLALLPENAAAWDICLRSLVCGIGFGCFQSPNNREMLSNVARENSSYASGILAIMRMFGQCLGTAIVGVILALFGQKNLLNEYHGVQTGLWLAVVSSVLAIILSISRLRKK